MGMRVCSTVGCPTIYDTAQGSRCPAHTKQADRAHWAKTRAYSTKGHRTFRAAVLHRDPICVICNVKESTVADHYPRTREHLLSISLNPNDPQYGRGLCKRCHDRHTAATSPGGWNTL